jgi:predicted RNA-binding protein with TRAM domain
MEISEELLCLFSATVNHQEGSYVLEVPKQEIQQGNVSADEVYKVALITTPSNETETPRDSSETEHPAESESGPPVDEGDIKKVEIVGLGDQGDGVGKVDGGYVVIVPETEPGDTVTVEIQNVRQNFAIAEVIQDHREYTRKNT